jgi:hypothetical protein
LSSCATGSFSRRALVPWSYREAITGDLRKLKNDELHNVYTLPNVISMIKLSRKRWAGHVACVGEKKSAYRGLAGKPEAKRPLGRPRHRLEDNIRMDFREMGWGSEHSNESSGPIKCWEIFEWLTNSWLLKEDSAPRG